MTAIPKEQQQARLSVCNTCPQNMNGRCRPCGCKVVDRIKKTDGHRTVRNRSYLTRPACPLKKWPEYRTYR
jgi:hypothetical protein